MVVSNRQIEVAAACSIIAGLPLIRYYQFNLSIGVLPDSLNMAWMKGLEPPFATPFTFREFVAPVGYIHRLLYIGLDLNQLTTVCIPLSRSFDFRYSRVGDDGF